MHEALAKDVLGGELVGHVSRDPTVIEGRKTPAPRPAAGKRPKGGRGRPRKGEEAEKGPWRLERQSDGMSLDGMPDDLPKACGHGARRNAEGFPVSWRGCRFHLDTADCGVPVSAVLTSAPVHDSQVAIPLAKIAAGRVASLRDPMDAAHDAKGIRGTSEGLGHVPVIDVNPRRDRDLREDLKREARALRACGLAKPESVRCRIRSGGRADQRAPQDGFGARHVRVREHAEVFGRLMFGVPALTAGQLMRLAAPP